MTLSSRDRAALEHDVKRIQGDVKNKEQILSMYRTTPSFKHLVPGLERQIQGLRQELRHCQDALRRG